MKLYELSGADRNLRFSPHVWRSKMALAHKGLDYESVPLRFGEIGEMLADCGSKTVPVLWVDGEWICDSWHIACFLEERYPNNPSLFDGHAGRAAARFFNLWADRSVTLSVFKAIVFDIPQHLTEADAAYFRLSREQRLGGPLEGLVDQRDKHLKEFHRQLSPVSVLLKEQPFISGDKPAYPDYILFGVFLWSALVSDAVISEPASPISDWREQMMDLFGGLARKSVEAAGR